MVPDKATEVSSAGGDGRVRQGAKDQDRLHREYAKKLEELENERKKLEDDKSQVGECGALTHTRTHTHTHTSPPQRRLPGAGAWRER